MPPPTQLASPLAHRRLLLNQLATYEKAPTSLLHQIEALEDGWISGWVHQEVCQILDVYVKAIEERRSPRLIIELPPGVGKTLMVSRHLPAHIFGRHPEWHQMVGTYNQEKADELGRDFRRVMEDDVYQSIFPRARIDGRAQSMSYLETTEAGKISFIGVGQGTGKRAHHFTVDDPVKNQEEAESPVYQKALIDWYMAVVMTRLHPGAGIIIMHTRWHELDLIGQVLATAARDPKADQFMRYRFPALAEQDEYRPDGSLRRRAGESLQEERFSRAEYEAKKATFYAAGKGRIWSALYQQNPIPEEGNFFKSNWFKWYKPGTAPRGTNRYLTTDFAASEGENDFSVTAPLDIDSEDNVWFGEDVFHAQCETSKHATEMFDRVEAKYTQGIFVERGVLLRAMKPLMRAEMERRRVYPGIIEFTRTKAKRSHAVAFANHLQAGKVYFPDTPFYREVVVPQLLAFDAGKNDDLVDALGLPFLSFQQLIRPEKWEDPEPVLAVDPTTEYINQMLDAADKPKRKRPAWGCEDD